MSKYNRDKRMNVQVGSAGSLAELFEQLSVTPAPKRTSSGDKAGRAIPLPVEITGDPQTKELARVWIGKKIYVLLNPTTGNMEPGEIGIILVDIARHWANMTASGEPTNRDEIVSQIADMFLKELKRPTSPIIGRIESCTHQPSK